jgi:ankyrin repeat protein
MLSKFKLPREESFSFLDFAKKGIKAMVQSDQWSELVDLLIERGVSVDAKNRTGETPLHLACLSGNKKMVLLLISRGATLTATTK